MTQLFNYIVLEKATTIDKIYYSVYKMNLDIKDAIVLEAIKMYKYLAHCYNTCLQNCRYTHYTVCTQSH